ncbi:unnamed protein product [Lampetra planeri]
MHRSVHDEKIHRQKEYIGPSRENYLPCSVCGRTFAPQSLKKHINVCRKQATKKRKVFDSQRQRFDGTEISTLKPKLASAKPLPQKKSNWRQEHEEFVKTIRAAKGVTQALKEGGPLPPPPPPSLNPDYVQCPCCQRRFNEGAAERHIMFCKEQAARIGRSGPSQQASSRLAVRIQVPPPAPPAPPQSPVPPPSPTSVEAVVPEGHLRVRFNNLSLSFYGTMTPARSPTPPSGYKSMGSSAPRRTGPTRAALNERNDGTPPGPSGRRPLPRFCHECGTRHPVDWAKFCCECGARRVAA